jgi:hypothetical protein
MKKKDTKNNDYYHLGEEATITDYDTKNPDGEGYVEKHIINYPDITIKCPILIPLIKKTGYAVIRYEKTLEKHSVNKFSDNDGDEMNHEVCIEICSIKPLEDNEVKNMNLEDDKGYDKQMNPTNSDSSDEEEDDDNDDYFTNPKYYNNISDSTRLDRALDAFMKKQKK